MGGCNTGFCDKIPNGDHSTHDRSGTARTRSGTANHPTRIYAGYGRGARTRTRKTRLGNCRGGPSSCLFGGSTWIGEIHDGRPHGQHFTPPKRDGGVRNIHDPIRCGIVGIRRHSIHTPLSRTPSHRINGRHRRRRQRRKTRRNFTSA